MRESDLRKDTYIEDAYIIEKIDKYYSVKNILEFFADFPYAAILDSSLMRNCLGRFTIIGYDPFLVFKTRNGKGCLIKRDRQKNIKGHPLELLRGLLQKYKTSWQDEEIPFIGGCIGYFSYDLVNFIEDIFSYNSDDIGINDLEMGFYNKVIIIDHEKRKTYAVGSSSGGKTANVQAEACNNLEDLKRILKNFEEINERRENFTKNYNCCPGENSLIANFSREQYIQTVSRAREYIRCGDIFQANLSQRFETVIKINPAEVYLMLREQSPSPFAAYLSFDELKVISSSPERLLKIKDRKIETRPIKGTRPRGRNIEEDKYNKEDLLMSEKDCSELTMIVDLSRNDLGKVCEIGSVVVDKLSEIEEYANVFHMVATVSGRMKEGKDVVDCLYAAFPGGSITGAPKVRACEIIEELEPVKRGIYTGSIGYIDFNGDSDLNIAIRTIVVKDNKAYYNVGGGIVWDSQPAEEYAETLHKGKIMMNVLKKAGRCHDGRADRSR